MISVKNKRRTRVALIFASSMVLCLPARTFSQSDPLSLDDEIAESVPIREAFNSTYVINNQSSNVLECGRLNVLILHRFGELSEGPFNAFGLDYAGMRMGFEYGITDKLTAALGRTSIGKNYDGHLKFRFKTQRQGGVGSFPVSLVAFSSVAFSATELRRQNSVQEKGQFLNQLVYTSEIIVSRQFSEHISIQFIPALVHFNSVKSADDNHNVYTLSTGCRLKINDRIHLTADYGYRITNIDHTRYNPLAIGIDIVTGGHTFNVYVSNSAGMIEKEFLTATEGAIAKGNMRIGFTMTRAFILKSKVTGGKLK